MTTTQPVNPVEVARIALKRLSERGLPPTPENYAQFYNAIVTIKSPETKNNAELQNAWQILVKLDDAVSDAHETTTELVEALVAGGERMSGSLDALQDAKQAHESRSMSVEEAHTALESLLNELIDSTNDIHSTVSTSTADLRSIRDAVKHIEQDLAFNRKMLEQDALTGALNRQGFDHVLATEVKRAQRHNSKLAVVMFDLDDFKLINDRHGHLTGDQVLIHVTNLAKAVLRESDVLVRYGGEEFLLLLPETDVHGAQYVVDRLRTVAHRTPFLHKNQRIDVNFSTGIAALKAEENGRALVLRADEAMYRAKHSGRGRVEVAE
ncbi:diguanylate cyclase (GGDEF) domain-containing protein [Andreprevotia lacus DSM 23236]|jgi:diguanylate cyclase|uniref:diguanylate cyclase n=1 Tax=Andreprevotia lacus DSM 23236 TaxID=1121001 RepID=A0A1W1XXG4_9NEIS|nr:GGDEF domain-containing protein [Andreprevotia lacus]SMC28659.1 diguanylate cyclase (GGDEF) domain-containing protein [Andreprevotia lacus DSM 23236]